MKTTRIALLLVSLLVLASPATAFAAGTADGRVVLGGTYTLHAGETLEGDLVVIGGTATLEAGSKVAGDVALIGGFLQASGEIDGDVFAIGGLVDLGPEALVRGDVTTMGAITTRDPAARVEGRVSDNLWRGTIDLEGPGIVLPDFDGFERPWIGWSFRWMDPFFGLGWSLVRSLVLAGVAVLAMMFWPDRTSRVARAVLFHPAPSFGAGLLAGAFAVAGIAVLVITVCLIPLALVAALLLAVALLFGWVAIGLEVGRRLALAFKREWSPATQAGLGTLLLSFVAYALDLLPCFGFFASMLLGLLGLGAVMLTRFGGQEWTGSTTSA